MDATSQEQLIQAVADQVATLAGKQGRTPEEILADMQRFLLTEKLRAFVKCNRADATAMGLLESDVDDLIHESRLGR